MRGVCYFAESGPKNTDETLRLAKKKALELGISYAVVATRSGETAIKAAMNFKETNIKVVAVAHAYGFAEPGKWLIIRENEEKLRRMNVQVVASTMPLSVGRLFRPAWKPTKYPRYVTTFPLDLVADTLRLFCQGMKVCVEIALMAADAGAISVTEEVIAIAGTHRGADTAIVLLPTHTVTLFDLKIREIIAKPR